MKVKHLLAASALILAGNLTAQDYQVLVSERNQKMAQGKFELTWESLKEYAIPL